MIVGRNSGVELSFSLHPQQMRAVNCAAQEVLYGGAAGGGKSHLIRVGLVSWALSAPGLQAYLFRRTFPELIANHLDGPGRFRDMLAPLVREGLVRISGKDIRFWNGSAILLRHLQHLKDRTIYQGHEIHALGIDEATHFTDEEYRFLRSRVRLGGWSPPDDCKWAFPRIIMGTNPGGRGHHWCKDGFVEHGPYKVHKTSSKEGGMTRCFIPAKLDDNPSMKKNDPEYRERLEGLGDPLLVRALLDGDWEVVEGAMYGYVWRKERHITQGFAIPWEWPIWIGADDGLSDPACFLWLTKDPVTETVYVIRELYLSDQLPDQLAEKVIQIHEDIPRCDIKSPDVHYFNEEPIQGIIDSAAFSRAGVHTSGRERKTSRGKQLQENGVSLIPCSKGPNSRVIRAQNVHRMLAPNPKEQGRRPRLMVFDGQCPNLVKTLPTLSRDEKMRDAVDTNEEDHAFDALCYGLQWSDGGVKKIKLKGV